MNDISHTPSPGAYVAPAGGALGHSAPAAVRAAAASQVDFTPEEYAAAAARISSALKEGWDPASQLEDANLDVAALESMGAAAAKIDPQKNGPSMLAFQELFIQLMHEIKTSERESASKSRAIAADNAEKSFKAQNEAADKEYSATLKKSIGQIVQGVGQAGVASSTPNVATAQAVGTGIGGMSELIAAGDQQDAAQARALANLIDKNRDVHMDDARRAQENAANATQAVSELSRAAGETMAANAELAKVVSRGS